MKYRKYALLVALTAFSFGALAKLPPLTDEQKAKVEGELLGKAQDRVAEKYIKEQKAKGVIVKPTPIQPPPAPAAAATPAPAAAPAAVPAAAPAAPK